MNVENKIQTNMKSILYGITVFPRGFTILFFLGLYLSSFAQSESGLPLWPLAVESSGNSQVVDWRPANTEIMDIPNTAPSNHAGTGAAFDHCGELVFYVIHTGVDDVQDNLFIYAADGTPLLTNSTPNAPGLNGLRSDGELIVVPVPGETQQWYIIYSKFQPNGANNGGYTPTQTLYALVEYSAGAINVIQRDIELTAGGVPHLYAW